MSAVQPIRSREKIDQIEKILRSKRNLRDYALFVFGRNIGLRISDIVKLEVCEVTEVVKGEIVIRDRLNIRERKTGKEADRLINNDATRALRRYLATRPISPDFRHEPLFLSQKRNRDGTMRSVGRFHIFRLMRDLALQVGILDNIGTHSLRKTYGYWLYKNETPLATIMRLLNHSSETQTLVYIGITRDMEDEAVRSLERKRNGKS